MAAVSIRYAEALLDSVSNKEKIGEGLEMISNLYLTNAEFKETMNNPRIKNDVKLDIIKEASLKDEVFVKFIDLLLKENRILL